jgi:hypothetical protein
MHYCSAELDADRSSIRRPPVESPPYLTPCRAKPPRSPTLFSHPLSQSASHCPPVAEVDELCDQLEESLEELEEGLDVLMILERAYERTLKAHVHPASTTDATVKDPGSAVLPEPKLDSPVAYSPHTTDIAFLDPAMEALTARISPALHLNACNEQRSTTEYTPLLAGSSTALVAILDHCSSTIPPTADAAGEASSNNAIGSGAVLRIAHLGDSVGILVRGEEIVWRSEEMWLGVRALIVIPARTPY